MALALSINSAVAAAEPGVSLFDAAERMGFTVPSSCRRQGKCRECLIEVAAGMEWLTPRAPEESHLRGNYRLACRCAVAAAGGEVKCHLLGRALLQIETGAINLAPGSGADRPDPAVTRDGDTIFLDGARIATGAGPIHGVAIDVGTTTVVARAINLETGAVVATASFENPQRFGGSDVMARIQYDTEHPGGILRRTLAGYLTRAIESLPLDTGSIYEYAVAGNPTMRDLLFGLDVRSIGQRPYWSLTQREFREGRRPGTSLLAGARSLGLPGHPRARVYGLPLIGGHVGSDAAACLLAIRPHLGERRVAIMDIGTNTELVIGNRHRLLAASCPAGPAFEGGAISCGMPGLAGAIARVAIGDDGAVACQVIGGESPQGICGSGLIDLLSELLRTGRMNAFGRLENGDEAFVVDAAAGISLRESDINELAQAKGANVAGLRIVAQRYGIALEDINVFYLAGGFGRHIDVDAARRIGLIPDLPSGRIVPVGNTSIEGASIALLSVSRRRELEALVATIGHVELETDPGFFDQFVAGCQFRPIASGREAPA